MIPCRYINSDGQVCKGFLFLYTKSKMEIPYLACTESDHGSLREFLFTQPRIDGVGQAEVISAIKRELEEMDVSPEEFKEFVDRAKDAYNELRGKGDA